MLITVPRSIMLDPTSFGDMNQLMTFGLDAPGLSGLGQDVDLSNLPTTTYVDDSGNDVTNPYSVLNTADLNTPVLSSTPLMTGGVPTTAQLNAAGSSNTAVAPSSNSTTAQDIAALGPALAGASKAIATATGPYQIPGTNYIYNPATGQILLNGAAVGTYNPATGQLTAISSLSSYLPLLIGLAAVFGIVMLMGNRK
jgi:hypothetical protein